jgi:hypothetical protein
MDQLCVRPDGVGAERERLSYPTAVSDTARREHQGTLDAFQRFVQAVESALTNAGESEGPHCQSDLCAYRLSA